MKPSGGSRFGPRRSLLLWLLLLWLMALGAASFWRATTLWQARDLLLDLGSTLSLPMLILFVTVYTLCGAALLVSTFGLWRRQEWGRRSARILIVLHYAVVQAYTWLFVRTGLLWQRRWVTLGLAVGTAGVSLGILTWRTSRRWLGLQ